MMGELVLVLAGKSCRLRPTFASLQALEKLSGIGLITLARKFSEGNFTLRECVYVIETGLMGAGETVPDDLGELLVKKGVASLSRIISRYLEAALVGEEPASIESPSGKE